MSALDFNINVVNFDNYISNLKNKGVLSDTTYYSYLCTIKRFIESGKDLQDIDTYNNFLFERSMKRRSYYVYYALIHFINFMYQDNATLKNKLLRNLQKPIWKDPYRQRKYLTEFARKEVIKQIKDFKHKLIARIQNETGVRAGDVIRLKRDGTILYEPYHDKITMKINFTGKRGRKFSMWIFDEELQSDIEFYMRTAMCDTDYWFCERGRCWLSTSNALVLRNNYRRYWLDLKNALKTCGIKYEEWATHDFRRSFARKVWDKTKDAVILKNALHHQNFNTTIRYLSMSGLQNQDLLYEMYEDKNKQ